MWNYSFTAGIVHFHKEFSIFSLQLLRFLSEVSVIILFSVLSSVLCPLSSVSL